MFDSRLLPATTAFTAKIIHPHNNCKIKNHIYNAEWGPYLGELLLDALEILHIQLLAHAQTHLKSWVSAPLPRINSMLYGMYTHKSVWVGRSKAHLDFLNEPTQKCGMLATMTQVKIEEWIDNLDYDEVIPWLLGLCGSWGQLELLGLLQWENMLVTIHLSELAPTYLSKKRPLFQFGFYHNWGWIVRSAESGNDQQGQSRDGYIDKQWVNWYMHVLVSTGLSRRRAGAWEELYTKVRAECEKKTAECGTLTFIFEFSWRRVT